MRVPLMALVGTLCLVLPGAGRAEQQPQPAAPARTPSIQANDNHKPAGTLANGVLTIDLIAGQGDWQPEGRQGRTLSVLAFREAAGALTIPSPLIRVPAGTEIRASIRNDAAGATLTVHGLSDRPATGASAPLLVPTGETREVRFTAREPGTYHYWASISGRPLGQRFDREGQLGGAFVVDPPGARTADRIFVIGLWKKSARELDPDGAEIGTINGRTWPHTERLDHAVGDRVSWRVVNLSFDQHAMHLHGVYFDVLATGNGLTSRAYPGDARPHVVTEHMPPGKTIDMQWTPQRPGNWLFHCHMTAHMTPPAGATTGAPPHHAVDASGGMAGLVVGIRVSGRAPAATGTVLVTPRQFTLKLREDATRYGTRSGYRMDVEGLDTTRIGPGAVPGPVIALMRDQPVEVTVVNEMKEPTAIHWHGIELDSYFDGVPGWGGSSANVTPAIDAGRTFIARFTPPRAGTFIYHTHWHDEAQLGGGLYGALIVLEPGRRFDPATDHVFIAGYDGVEERGQREPIAINGRGGPAPAPAPGPVATPLRANVTNRIRLINITPNNVALTFVLTDGFKPVMWKPAAKDGADLPASQTATRPAQQLVSVGETYDFEIQPAPGQRLWLELRRGNGEWVTQALLIATESGS